MREKYMQRYSTRTLLVDSVYVCTQDNRSGRRMMSYVRLLLLGAGVGRATVHWSRVSSS